MQELLQNVKRFVFDKSTALSITESGSKTYKPSNKGNINGNTNSQSNPEAFVKSKSAASETSAELLRRQIVWETWSGNKPLPDPQLFRFVKPHSPSNSGPTISIPFKSVVWQRLSAANTPIGPFNSAGEDENDESTTLHSSPGYPDRRSDASPLDESPPESELCKRLSFPEFFRALPSLFVLYKAVANIQRHVVEFIPAKGGKILLKGQSCETVYLIRYWTKVASSSILYATLSAIRRGSVQVTQPNALNPLIEETVLLLGWFVLYMHPT